MAIIWKNTNKQGKLNRNEQTLLEKVVDFINASSSGKRKVYSFQSYYIQLIHNTWKSQTLPAFDILLKANNVAQAWKRICTRATATL